MDTVELAKWLCPACPSVTLREVPTAGCLNSLKEAELWFGLLILLLFLRAVNVSCYPPVVLTLYYWAASLTMQLWSDRIDTARTQQFPGFEGVCVGVGGRSG